MGAGNEFVSFQVAFPGNQTGISVATGRALTGPGGTIPNFIAWTLPLINGTAPTQLAGAKLTTVAVNASWKEMAQQKGFTDRAVSYLSGACDDVSRENKNHKWEGCVDAVKDFRRQWTGIPNVMTTNIDSVNLHDPNFDVTDVLAPVVDQMDDVEGDFAGDQHHKYDPFRARPGKQVWMYTSCDVSGCTLIGERHPKYEHPAEQRV